MILRVGNLVVRRLWHHGYERFRTEAEAKRWQIVNEGRDHEVRFAGTFVCLKAPIKDERLLNNTDARLM